VVLIVKTELLRKLGALLGLIIGLSGITLLLIIRNCCVLALVITSRLGCGGSGGMALMSWLKAKTLYILKNAPKKIFFTN
jgi:hypothetical protein